MAEDEDTYYTLSNSRRQRGTRYIMGKPYHYATDAGGQLVLLPGPDPRTTDFGAIVERESR